MLTVNETGRVKNIPINHSSGPLCKHWCSLSTTNWHKFLYLIHPIQCIYLFKESPLWEQCNLRLHLESNVITKPAQAACRRWPEREQGVLPSGRVPWLSSWAKPASSSIPTLSNHSSLMMAYSSPLLLLHFWIPPSHREMWLLNWNTGCIGHWASTFPHRSAVADPDKWTACSTWK